MPCWSGVLFFIDRYCSENSIVPVICRTSNALIEGYWHVLKDYLELRGTLLPPGTLINKLADNAKSRVLSYNFDKKYTAVKRIRKKSGQV